MESLFAELAANKVLGTLPRTELSEYLGGGGYMGATLEKAGIIPEPSMAQVHTKLAWCVYKTPAHRQDSIVVCIGFCLQRQATHH